MAIFRWLFTFPLWVITASGYRESATKVGRMRPKVSWSQSSPSVLVRPRFNEELEQMAFGNVPKLIFLM